MEQRHGTQDRDRNYLENFEMWTWSRMQNIKWTNLMRNEIVYEEISWKQGKIRRIKERKAWFQHLRWNWLIEIIIQSKIKGKRLRK